MALTFSELQSEVKRRATRNQAGTTFDTAVKNTLNTSLLRVAREAPWRSLRRKTTFDTVISYTGGNGAVSVTNGSKVVSVTGATFLTNNIVVGRRVKFGGSAAFYTIKNITSETGLILDSAYDGSSSATQTYEILPQDQYNLPIQASHRVFLWHEDYGYPFQLSYVPEQDFIMGSVHLTDKNVPTHYRMWGEDMVETQLRTATNLSVASSSASDTTQVITVFGTVGGYPDVETITCNGTTSVTGTNTFTSIERVVKNGSTTGRVTLTSVVDSKTVTVIPAGAATYGVQYAKIQLWPLPNNVFPMNVQYYKDPFYLVNDGDVHELGYEFDEAIILLSTSKIKMEENQDEGDKFYALYQDEVRSLKKTNMDKIDWFPRLKKAWGNFYGREYVHRNLLYRQAGGDFGPATRR